MDWFAGQEILPLLSRTAAVNAANFYLGRARGMQYTLYVKTAGTGTITFRVNGITMMEGLAQQISTNVVISAAGFYIFALHPAAALQPPGESAVTVDTAVVKQAVGMCLPAVHRMGLAKSDGSAWVFGVSGRRLR